MLEMRSIFNDIVEYVLLLAFIHYSPFIFMEEYLNAFKFLTQSLTK